MTADDEARIAKTLEGILKAIEAMSTTMQAQANLLDRVVSVLEADHGIECEDQDGPPERWLTDHQE